MPLLRFWKLIVLLPAALLVALVVWARWAPRPASLGVRNGQLASCPQRPNCVCSQATDAAHAIEPFPLADPAAFSRLEALLRQTPRTRVITATETYLHAECRSRWIGFIDDVEFVVDRSAGVIHGRSASRLGHADFGVNRARLERLRQQFLEPAP